MYFHLQNFEDDGVKFNTFKGCEKAGFDLYPWVQIESDGRVAESRREARRREKMAGSRRVAPRAGARPPQRRARLTRPRAVRSDGKLSCMIGAAAVAPESIELSAFLQHREGRGRLQAGSVAARPAERSSA